MVEESETTAMKTKFIDGGFLPIPDDWIETPGFQECPPGALKILVAIIHYWVEGGMKDNGNLVGTYKMLGIATGIRSKTTLALGLRQLEALGILAMNRGKWSNIDNHRQPNRYRLPWLAGHNGGPPTKEYLEITSREHARLVLEGLKEKRKDPKARKMRVIVEFEGI
jgi:hypothetical protein